MRITGGTARGRTIEGPVGLTARPTASKIRQAFFNILRNNVPGARFLDLCAGTGLMGLEALSRGARSLIAVEENRRLARGLELDLSRLGFEGEVICADVRKVLPLLDSGAFDIIYADPPYKSRIATSILQGVSKGRLLAPAGVLAVEHARADFLPEDVSGLVQYDKRCYGQSAITFYCFADMEP